MVGGNVEKFIFSPVDRGRKLLEKLLMRSRIKEPPSLLLRMFLQYKNGLKQRNWRLNLKKIEKDDKTSKDTNRIRSRLSGNDLVQVEDIGKKRIRRKSEFRLKELLIDGNIAIRRTNNPVSFVGRHQPIPTGDMIISPYLVNG